MNQTDVPEINCHSIDDIRSAFAVNRRVIDVAIAQFRTMLCVQVDRNTWIIRLLRHEAPFVEAMSGRYDVWQLNRSVKNQKFFGIRVEEFLRAACRGRRLQPKIRIRLAWSRHALSRRHTYPR